MEAGEWAVQRAAAEASPVSRAVHQEGTEEMARAVEKAPAKAGVALAQAMVEGSRARAREVAAAWEGMGSLA